ncbi:MAG: alpha/beta fold hydrolase [Flavobacteriales bacterium]|nr:alpha/beta fold hydrolase [Flavobacteriales bacterium]
MTRKPRSRRRRILIILGIFIGLNLILGTLGFYFVGPYYILEPPTHCTDHEWDVPYEELEIRGENDVPIAVLHTPAADSTKGVVILVHGIGSCKRQWVSVAALLARRGYASIAVDLRTHGNSGGEYCTFGYHEKQDIKQVADWAFAKYPSSPVGIWGNSLGGAIGLQSLENDPRLQFGVIECTFTTMHQIVYDYHRRHVGFAIEWMVDRALDRAGEIAAFDPEAVAPVVSCTHIHQPVIISHGTDDPNIDFAYGKELFNALASGQKEFVPVEGGHHNDLHTLGGWDYLNHFIDFIDHALADKQLMEQAVL